jgi:hypothetical protein
MNMHNSIAVILSSPYVVVMPVYYIAGMKISPSTKTLIDGNLCPLLVSPEQKKQNLFLKEPQFVCIQI